MPVAAATTKRDEPDLKRSGCVDVMNTRVARAGESEEEDLQQRNAEYLQRKAEAAGRVAMQSSEEEAAAVSSTHVLGPLIESDDGNEVMRPPRPSALNGSRRSRRLRPGMKRLMARLPPALRGPTGARRQ